MPTKETDAGRKYEVDGKKFVWYPLDDNDEVTDLTVSMPLRVKLGVIRKMNDRDLDAGAMFEIVLSMIPDQGDVLDEMDVNDFTEMFSAWSSEYQALQGASLGEAPASQS